MDEATKRNWQATSDALKIMQSRIDAQNVKIENQQLLITQINSVVQDLKKQIILYSVNGGSGPTT